MEERVEEQKVRCREQGPHPQEVRGLRNRKASDGETQDGEEEAGDLDEEGSEQQRWRQPSPKQKGVHVGEAWRAAHEPVSQGSADRSCPLWRGLLGPVTSAEVRFKGAFGEEVPDIEEREVQNQDWVGREEEQRGGSRVPFGRLRAWGWALRHPMS